MKFSRHQIFHDLDFHDVRLFSGDFHDTHLFHDTGNFMSFYSENCDFFHNAVSRHFHRSMKFHDVFTTFSQRLPPVVYDLLLYADDSALLIRGKNITDIGQKFSEKLTKLNVWLIDNKLSLHLGKTDSILFASNRKLKQDKFLRISCNGTIKVGGKEVVTYLGRHIDQYLSGKSMA